jgi:uncharacterized damage-inducible protein DinB
MRPIDLFVSELDREGGVTRTLLERLPEDKAAWKPHPKSFSLGDLALHLANLPTWINGTLAHSEFDLHPPGAPPQPARAWASKAALLAEFDANVAAARAALVAAADAELQAPWTLKNGGRPLFTMPKGGVLRTWVFNHLVHHRGQLSVYLRLCDVPLPSMFGPTADQPL